jgi:hypothetical protein
MSIAPGILNLTFPQGATWDLSLTYVDGDGDPIDLTAHTARMQVRNSYTADPPVLSLASGTGITLGGTAGTIDIQVAASSVVVNEVTGAVTVVAAGPRGVQGEQGDAATVAVGTTSTGAPGSDATVTNSGTSGAAVLDFAIPRGDVGQQGIQGEQGIQGVPGNAATVTAGTTTTGAPGSSASVTNSGSSSAAVFDFAIPEGVQGQQGIQGIPGDAATVAAGTTTTGAAGSSASVTNSGSSSAAVFDFTIPQGIQGVQGIQGIQGVPGEGVPAGGATGQVLSKVSGTNYDTAWNDPTFSWSTAAGSYYGPNATAQASAGGLSNRITAIPMFFPKPTPIDRIAFRITAGGAAGSLVRLGVYAPTSDGLPGVLLHDFGTVDGTVAANPVEITVSVTLEGFVWLAARVNDQAPTVITATAVAALWAPKSTAMTGLAAGVQSAVQSSGSTLVDPFPLASASEGAAAVNIRVRAA